MGWSLLEELRGYAQSEAREGGVARLIRDCCLYCFGGYFLKKYLCHRTSASPFSLPPRT